MPFEIFKRRLRLAYACSSPCLSVAAMFNVHTPEYMEFVARLRSARRGKHITQRDLASRLGKPQSYVSKIETCERRIDVIETALWCLQLGITFSDVLPPELASALPAVDQLKSQTKISDKE